MTSSLPEGQKYKVPVKNTNGTGFAFKYSVNLKRLHKSSQFSHKQLVLVTAPVSTGAYCLCLHRFSFTCIVFYCLCCLMFWVGGGFIFSSENNADDQDEPDGGTDHIGQNIFHVKVAAGYKIFLHIFHPDAI